MYEIQFHSDFGADESFEAQNIVEANRIMKSEKTSDTRRIVVIRESNGEVIYEWVAR